MEASFYERPILNSPYAVPSLHHALDATGQPLDQPPVAGRRRSDLITPVPRAKKTAKKAQQKELTLSDAEGLSTAEQEYNPTPIINEIRRPRRNLACHPQPEGLGRHAGHNPPAPALAQPREFLLLPPVLLPARGG